ncbi:MAG: cellulase family glycosylhydrolase [Polyangia bacterium]
MERHFKSQRHCGWLRNGLDLRALGSVLLIALLAGCSSTSSPDASAGGRGGASSSTIAGGGQTIAGGATSATGGSSVGTTASSGGITSAGGVTGGTTSSSGSMASSGGTTTSSSGGTTSRGGITAGGTTSGAGTPTSGSLTAGGTTARGGTASTGGASSTGGTASTGRPDAGADAAQDVATPDVGAGGAGGVGGTGGNGGSVAGGGSDPSDFHCMNWADNRDNFNTGHLLLSGMTSDTDTYAGVTTTANIVLTAFTDLLQANSYRMPINEPTVLDSWWNSYKAAIDVGIAKGMKVIIGYWASNKTIGTPADIPTWYSMWQVVIDAYVSNPLVYYDIHNEPHGYTPQQWTATALAWIAHFPNVPSKQIIVAGSGWDDNVANVAASFPGLMMEVHDYADNGPTTQAGWNSDLLGRLGNAVSRTIVGEWAGNVIEDFTTGIDGDANKSFIVGMADTIYNNKMGSCWWAGAFAPSGGTSGTTFLVQKGTGATMTYTIQGAASLAYVQHSWGLN